jgi:rSAM/selenodomain-associated transferase 1
MAKSPRLGAVKKRLAASLGPVTALRVYRSCLAHTLRRLGDDQRWRAFLAVTPDGDVTARLWSQMAPSRGIASLAQGEGDLGQRMQRLFNRLPPGPVVIIGGDIPDVRASQIAHAFRLLGRHDAVFGPAEDGGYWLVGLKRSPRLLAPFRHVRWSGPHALADTLANLEGWRVATAALLRDLDTADDYRRLRAAAERLIPPARD